MAFYPSQTLGCLDYLGARVKPRMELLKILSIILKHTFDKTNWRSVRWMSPSSKNTYQNQNEPILTIRKHTFSQSLLKIFLEERRLSCRMDWES